MINLEKVRYIDSTGLGVLIGGLKRVREHGGSVNLVCTNPQIKKIFDITGLVKIFGIFETKSRDEGAGMNPASEHARRPNRRAANSGPRRVGSGRASRRGAVASRQQFSIEEIEDIKLAVAEAAPTRSSTRATASTI